MLMVMATHPSQQLKLNIQQNIDYWLPGVEPDYSHSAQVTIYNFKIIFRNPTDQPGQKII